MKQELHFTRVYDAKTEAALSKTHAGQAHFAGTGPDGKSCRQCVHWAFAGHYAIRSHHGGALKPAPCGQFKRMMNAAGAPVPAKAKACRFFSELEDAEKLRPLRAKE